MYLTKEVKAEIFKKYAGSETNTGSAEGQIALFTLRINHLTEHLKVNRKDFNTERSFEKQRYREIPCDYQRTKHQKISNTKEALCLLLFITAVFHWLNPKAHNTTIINY